jgi:hypothetical protein
LEGGGGEEGWESIIEGVNMIKVNYIYIWKCHNETHYTIQLMCANKKGSHVETKIMIVISLKLLPSNERLNAIGWIF